MSRSGYSNDFDNWSLIRWRGIVASSIRGKRGQKLLKDLANALDAMTDKKLIIEELKSEYGYCALGVVGEKRCLNLNELDPEDTESVADAFDVAEPLVREIVYLNDEVCVHRTPEERWTFMREWVKSKLKDENESSR